MMDRNTSSDHKNQRRVMISPRNANRRPTMAAKTVLDTLMAALILCAGAFVGAALLGIIP